MYFFSLYFWGQTRTHSIQIRRPLLYSPHGKANVNEINIEINWKFKDILCMNQQTTFNHTYYEYKRAYYLIDKNIN